MNLDVLTEKAWKFKKLHVIRWVSVQYDLHAM